MPDYETHSTDRPGKSSEWNQYHYEDMKWDADHDDDREGEEDD
jgi:hypothetical protein